MIWHPDHTNHRHRRCILSCAPHHRRNGRRFYMAYTGLCVMGASIDICRHAGGCLAHLQKLSDNYFNNTKVGQIMSCITDLFLMSQNLPTNFLPGRIFIAFLKSRVVSFVILAGINSLLTVIIFVPIPVMAVSCLLFQPPGEKSLQTPEKPLSRAN